MPAFAYDPNKFPGQGSRADFEKSWLYSNKGIVLKEQGKFAEAIEEYKIAISIYPYCAAHFCNYGNALNHLDRYADAIDAFRKAVNIAPDCTQAYADMADIYLKQKQYAEAESICKQALRLDSKSAMSMINLAEAYLGEKKPDEARKWLNAAIACPESKQPEYNKAISADFEKLGKLSRHDAGE